MTALSSLRKMGVGPMVYPPISGSSGRDLMMPADPAEAPTRRPETYPGEIPGYSYLLCGRWYARIKPIVNRRLAQAIVCDLRSEFIPESAGNKPLPLSFVLLKLNASPMNRRTAVLAVGSNAAPSQLALKFESRNVNAVVPVIRARVGNLGIAYSAHLNVNGYLPAAPVHTGDKALLESAQVLFLDSEQLNAVDDSEPNYTRVQLSWSDYPLTLDNEEQPATYAVYRTRHGVVRPLSPSLGPFFDATKLTSQAEVISQLLEREPRLGNRLHVASYAELREKSAALAPSLRTVLEELGLRSPDGLVIPTVQDAATYGESTSSFDLISADEASPYLKVVLETPNVVKRGGEAVVQISSRSAERFGWPGHVVVVRYAEKRPYATEAQQLRVVAAVQVVKSGLDDNHARLDQILRHALGSETREKSYLYPVRLPGSHNRIVLPPRYLIARVQTADIMIVEQQGCFLPQSALDLLGIASGDVLIVEGCRPSQSDYCQNSFEISTVRLKAYAASEELLNQRAQISGGGFESRYPSARDALGVYPDLPWVFLDAGTRELLGVGKLGAVRIRAGRAYQLSKELRELMVLLLIAAVGASTQITSKQIAAILFVTLAVVSALVVLLRLRVRLRAPAMHSRIQALRLRSRRGRRRT